MARRSIKGGCLCGAVRYAIKGKPKYYRSSKWAARGFCAKCGGTLVYKLVKDKANIWIAIGSLDDLGAVTPAAHIFTTTMAPWLKLADRLPRHNLMP
ncbi:MAG: GFA family protein [Alphaproteobacteria bacterium]